MVILLQVCASYNYKFKTVNLKMIKSIDLFSIHEGIPFEVMMAEIARDSPVIDLIGGLSSVVSQRNMYTSPPGYLKWETHFRICASYLSEKVLSRATMSKEAVEYSVAKICLQAVACKAPARYISKEICEAFINTSIPSTERELAEIFPALHIFLPRNYLFDWENCEITSLVVHPGVLRPEGKEIDQETRVYAKMALNHFSSGIYSPPEDLCNVPVFSIAGVTSTGCVANSYIGGEGAILNKGKESEIPARRSVYEKINRIAINALLIHLHEPELITIDVMTANESGKGFGKSKKPGTSLPVTWIGKNFRYQREQPPGPGASRVSVKSHWRRGHWHTILHGKKRQQRRTQWFKPIYVGSK